MHMKGEGRVVIIPRACEQNEVRLSTNTMTSAQSLQEVFALTFD